MQFLPSVSPPPPPSESSSAGQLSTSLHGCVVGPRWRPHEEFQTVDDPTGQARGGPASVWPGADLSWSVRDLQVMTSHHLALVSTDTPEG